MSNIRTTGKKSSNTLVRDLVNVGIFGALYVIISFLVAFIGYIPVFIVVVCGLVGLVASIPVFVFFAKIDRPVLCCTLFCFLFGMVMFLTGHDWTIIAMSVLGGLLAGIALHVSKKSFWGCILANMAISLAPSSMLLPLWTNTEQYLELAASMCDEEYVAYMTNLGQSYWPLVVEFGLGFIGCFIGSFIAKRVMKKHFERIGITK